MTPLIRPLPKQCQPQTEYQNERLIFAEMKVALRRRKRRQRVLWLMSLVTGQPHASEPEQSSHKFSMPKQVDCNISYRA